MNRTLSSLHVWAQMVKLEHSVFALPFAFIATFLAGRHLPDAHRPLAGQLALIVVCMVAARSAAMTFNRIVDAGIDARNPRTAGRPLPAGRLSTPDAWMFFAVCCGVFLAGCWGFRAGYGNDWPVRLAAPVLIYLCGYSYTKRFTRWSHYYLGTAIAISPSAAWLAIHPDSIGWPAVLLSATVALWIAGFDIIYACQDMPVDRRDGLHSLPATIGPGAALWMARASHASVVALLVVLGRTAELGNIYYIGVAIVAVLLLVENLLVRTTDFSRVNLAFFTINGVVGVVLGVLTVTDVLLRNASSSR
ncbi:MAG: UbiA family prenyltransferase [Phycisphaerales bacterium]|nr:UbiA family prenyltransferase [Phycisphaerales bacterium]